METVSSNLTLKDGRQIKLGRIRPKARRQCLNLAAYYDASKDTAPPPTSVDWAAKAMASLSRWYNNDQYGCCVPTSSYHGIGIWTGNDTPAVALATDAEVLNAYHTICGPGDNGCVITDVLDYARDHGLLCNGVRHKIDGYVSVDWTNKKLVMVAIDLFGGGRIGINLPDAWTCTNCTWDVTNTRIVGGHDVRICGYDSVGVKVSTWAGLVTITWDAFLSTRWIEEMYVELSPDWYNSDKLAPNGIDVATLKADLDMIGGGGLPPLPDPVPPTPIPPGPVPPVPVPPGPFPPPLPPVPQFIVVNIPSQVVYGHGGRVIGHVPAFSVHAELPNLAAFSIPPWLIPILRVFCASAATLPPPYNVFAMLVCSMIPPAAASSPCGCL